MALKNYLEELKAKEDAQKKERDEAEQREKERIEKVKETAKKLVNEIIDPTISDLTPDIEGAGFVVTRIGELKDSNRTARPLTIKKNSKITQLEFSFDDYNLKVVRFYSMISVTKNDDFAQIPLREVTAEKIDEVIEQAIWSMENHFKQPVF